MKRHISRLLPESLKRRARPYLHGWQARRLAATSKRLDICAAQFAHILNLAGGLSLAGKTCLEIGAGWVLSHALVCHLLGAKRILAVDIEPIAHPEALSIAVGNSVSYLVPDILSQFEDHSLVRQRFDQLRSIRRFDLQVLKGIGVEYLSPWDIARQPLCQAVDFVYSQSVLEHVPQSDVPLLLESLTHNLTPGGTMIHCIHLEDHEDLERWPFRFLTLPASEYPRWRETNTGNRIRASGWQKRFAAIADTRSKPIYAFSRTELALPEVIDCSIDYTDEADLRVSHLAMLTTKLASIPMERDSISGERLDASSPWSATHSLSTR